MAAIAATILLVDPIQYMVSADGADNDALSARPNVSAQATFSPSINASEMDEATRTTSLDSNPALLLATAWFHLVEHQSLRNMVVLPYCDRICLMSKYLQQLVMESVGKNGKGISVFGNKGSTDQHSYVQQLRDGYKDFFAMFLRVLNPEVHEMEVEPGVTAGDYLMAFQEGTAKALTETGRPSMRITVERFNEHTLGALIGLFERAVGYYGAMLGINSYHQPGVEAGKTAAGELLAAQQAVLKHLPDDAVQLARDDARLKDFAAQLRASENLEALTDDFVSDLLKRCARHFGLGNALWAADEDAPARSNGNGRKNNGQKQGATGTTAGGNGNNGPNGVRLTQKQLSAIWLGRHIRGSRSRWGFTGQVSSLRAAFFDCESGCSHS